MKEALDIAHEITKAIETLLQEAGVLKRSSYN